MSVRPLFRLLLVLSATVAACGPKPEPPPSPVVRTPAPPSPPKPPTFEEKLRKVREAEQSDPRKFRTLHEAWWHLAAEAKETKHEATILEKLELLEGAANKAYREVYRPLQSEIRRLVADRRPREARDRLMAWKVPFEMDIQELLSADRGRELETLNELVGLEERRGRLNAAIHEGNILRDPAAELNLFVLSARVAVHAEAERSILELRRLRAAEQRRQRIVAAPREGRAAFGERPGTPVATEKRFEGKIPPQARESLDSARKLLPRFLAAPRLEEFISVATDAAGHATRAVDAAGFLPVAYYYRAEWRYAGLGNTLGALTDLDEAIRRHPQFVEARLARARLAVELDLADQARKELGLLARALPEPAKGALARARAHSDAKKKTETILEIDRAFRSMPDDLSFLNEKTRDRPEEPEWTSRAETFETANYVLKAERSSPERLRARGEALEAALAWFPSIVRIDRAPPRKPRVFIFGDEEAYSDFVEDDAEGMLSRSAGKYFSKGRRIFLYEREGEPETRETLLHEAWHEYIDRSRGSIPTWLDEGLAEYAGSAELKAGRVADVLPNRDNLRILESGFAEGWNGLPFAEIMGETQREFYGTLRSLQYAQAWSMVHFFRHAEKGRYATAFQAYLSLAAGGASRSRAFEQTLGKEELPKAQDEWRAYVRGLKQ